MSNSCLPDVSQCLEGGRPWPRLCLEPYWGFNLPGGLLVLGSPGVPAAVIQVHRVMCAPLLFSDMGFFDIGISQCPKTPPAPACVVLVVCGASDGSVALQATHACSSRCTHRGCVRWQVIGKGQTGKGGSKNGISMVKK